MTHPSLASVHLSAADAGIQGETSNVSFWCFLICGSEFGALQGWTAQVLCLALLLWSYWYCRILIRVS